MSRDQTTFESFFTQRIKLKLQHQILSYFSNTFNFLDFNLHLTTKFSLQNKSTIITSNK